LACFLHRRLKGSFQPVLRVFDDADDRDELMQRLGVQDRSLLLREDYSSEDECSVSREEDSSASSNSSSNADRRTSFASMCSVGSMPDSACASVSVCVSAPSDCISANSAPSLQASLSSPSERRGSGSGSTEVIKRLAKRCRSRLWSQPLPFVSGSIAVGTVRIEESEFL
jgi:hypothetical protein